MWITEVEEGKSYQTRAESHGYIYLSKHTLEEIDGKTLLKMDFDAIPVEEKKSIGRMLQNLMMRLTMKGAFQKDLNSIRDYVESL